MKVLWLCNGPTTAAAEQLQNARGIGWIDGALAGIRNGHDAEVAVCFPYKGTKELTEGKADGIRFWCVPASPLKPHKYWKPYEKYFTEILQKYQPDIIHIWGTEYSHTLAMIRAAQEKEKTVVSIQGLCSILVQHYYAGISLMDRIKITPRDIVRGDSMIRQRKRFVFRGKNETEALKQVSNVIGRTDWDKACVKRINSDIHYYHCNETLRDCFYHSEWKYENCSKHTIFSSQSFYPVKGFHLLLQALPDILKEYPDTIVYTTGTDPRDKSIIHLTSYDQYIRKLIKRNHLEGHIKYLGYQNQAQMVERYLDANVFVLPSSIENSPNSLGEAMLIGTPCVAADVGGVSNFITHKEDGYTYQSDAPYMMAYFIKMIFEEERNVMELSQKARCKAGAIYDQKKNAEELMRIYGHVLSKMDNR